MTKHIIIPVDVMQCSFVTLWELRDQIPRDRWEQIKQARPDFEAWLAVTECVDATR